MNKGTKAGAYSGLFGLFIAGVVLFNFVIPSKGSNYTFPMFVFFIVIFNFGKKFFGNIAKREPLENEKHRINCFSCFLTHN